MHKTKMKEVLIMKNRTKSILVLLSLLLVLVAQPIAQASALEDAAIIQPKTTANINCSLSKYSSTELRIYVAAQLTSVKTVNITAQLQRWNGSGWDNYGGAYGTTKSSTFVTLYGYPSPPKGYTYRVYAIVGISGVGVYPIYSNELYW